MSTWLVLFGLNFAFAMFNASNGDLGFAGFNGCAAVLCLVAASVEE